MSEPAPPPTPKDAPTLLRALATIPGLEARFHERKQLALLKAPLESEGRLYYAPPGHLVRIVESPSRQTVRIGPTSLEVIDDRGTQTIDLSGRPDVKLFVESFARVLAGDYEALEAAYAVQFELLLEDSARWRLTLRPKSPMLAHLVDRLELEGRGYAIDTIRVLETRGDSSITSIVSADPTRRFSPAEREAIFGLEPSPP